MNIKKMFSINPKINDALSIILKSIQDSSIEKRRIAALVMFEIILNNVEEKGNESYSRLLQTLYDKAVQGFSNGRDSRFEEYVHRFEELLKTNEGEETKNRLETRTQVVEIMDELKNRLPYSYWMNQCVEKLESEAPSLAMKKLKRLERELKRLA